MDADAAQSNRRVRSRWLLPLFFILLTAFVLRLHNIDNFSFWTDEGLTPLRSGYSIARILSNEITIQDGVGRDTHPALFYLLIHVSRRVFGETDFAYRYPAVLAGVLLIPVLFQLGRRLGGRGLGITAAFLTAVNPLQIWYSNEARMYTLAVLLAALAAYALWRGITSARPYRYALLYLFLAGLTIYTHYTAVFLIGAQTAFWAWALWRGGQRKLLLGTAVALIAAAIPIIYANWPRLFTGAEANYFYVSPRIMIQDVVHAFGLGLTADVKLFSVKLLDLAAWGLLLAGVIGAGSWLRRSFLLVYLYAIVFGLMAGSLIKPMYQGARHIMLGSPAFLLLVAWGFVWLFNQARAARRRAGSAAWGVLAGLGGLALLTGPALSLTNLYTNPHYAKNDFRALIAYVERMAGENDVFLYNDAVLLPLHEHYRQRTDIAYTALPTYPYRVNAQTEADLTALTQQFDRIWYVTNPPADKRDADGFVRAWLDAHLTEINDRNFDGHTVEVRTITYTTAPPLVDRLPPDGRSLDIRWPAMPPLRGIRLDGTQPVALPAVRFDLFWQADTPVNAGTEMRFTLRGPNDETYLIQGQTLPQTAVSPQKELIRQSCVLSIPFGTPPGSYALYGQPLVSSTGPALGEPQKLADIALASSDHWPVKGERPYTSPSLHFQNGLSLLGAAFPDNEVRPGHNLPFTLYWQADSPLPADMRYELAVIAPDGQVWKRQEGIPGAAWLDPWPTNAPIAQPTSLYFNPETEPGVYRLRWRLLDETGTIGGRPSWRPWRTAENELGTIEVVPWPLNTTLPDAVTPIRVNFGPDIQLAGFMYENSGETLDVVLYWRAQSPPQADYFSFVHIVNEAGEIAAQQAFVPVNGLRPSRGWRENEVLEDAYTFDLTADLPPGDYAIIVGLFNPETGERPSVSYHDQPQADNQFTLGTITLP